MSTPQPVTPYIKKAAMFVVIAGALLVYYAAHRTPTVPHLSDIRLSRPEFLNAARPKPILMAQPMVRPSPKPLVAPSIPHAQPTPCQPCEMRAERYRKAVQTGFDDDKPGTRVLPQRFVPNALAFQP